MFTKMLYAQKSTANRAKKKPERRDSVGKNIKVIKHFQPKFIHHNGAVEQRDFPEVNSDFDINQSLNTVKTVKSYSHHGANSNDIFYKKRASVSNKVSENIQVKNCNHAPQKKVMKTIFSPISVEFHLKSKSCVEERALIDRNINDTFKSKSFVNEKCTYTSDSSTINSDSIVTKLFEESKLDKLKKEIIINRIEGFRSFSTCSERKDKLENIRREISLLINPLEFGEKTCENLKSKIGELSRQQENLFVYNINEAKNYNKHVKEEEDPSLIFEKEEVPTKHNECPKAEGKETQSKYRRFFSKLISFLNIN